MTCISAVGPISWKVDRGWCYADNGRPLALEHLRVLGLEGRTEMPPVPLHVEDKRGDKGKREKPWPVDRSITCYTSRESRGIHVIMPCHFYRGVVTRMMKTGGVMLPIETVTVQEGFDRDKGLCTCWDRHFTGARRVVAGAGIGFRP